MNLFTQLRSHAAQLPRFIRKHATTSAIASTRSTGNIGRRARIAALGLTCAAGAAWTLHSITAHPAVAEAAATTPDGNNNSTNGSRSTPKRHVSDITAVDYRTLGLEPCPTLPADCPKWLRQLAADPGFQYRNLGALLCTEGHFLFDGLAGERRLREYWYFSEKLDLPEDAQATPTAPQITRGSGSDSADADKHPHLAPNLDFQPAKPQRLHTSADTAAAAASSSKAAPPAAFSRDAVHAPPLTAAGPEVRAVFHVGEALCGHRGIVHGGMTAALMDDVSGAATFCAAGGGNFTANLTINYLKPVRADQYLLLRAQAVKQEGRKIFVNISVEDGKGEVFARGTALYVKPKRLPAAVLLSATQ